MALAYLAARRKDARTGKAEMQHRHFATVAAIIKDFGYPQERRRIAEHFARELASTNPRFDRERFIAACLAED